jgi:hypothetical protein
MKEFLFHFQGSIMSKLINLTPHAIVLALSNGDRVTIPSSGIARVTTLPSSLEEIEGIPVPVASRTQFGEIVGLPDSQEGTFFIVSLIVAGALNGSRHDCLCPGTGPNDNVIRFADGPQKGQIEAVTRLNRA